MLNCLLVDTGDLISLCFRFGRLLEYQRPIPMGSIIGGKKYETSPAAVVVDKRHRQLQQVHFAAVTLKLESAKCHVETTLPYAAKEATLNTSQEQRMKELPMPQTSPIQRPRMAPSGYGCNLVLSVQLLSPPTCRSLNSFCTSFPTSQPRKTFTTNPTVPTTAIETLTGSIVCPHGSFPYGGGPRDG